ncbi:MAG: heme-binding protein [Acetobacteraceae bacterium]|nr:heme-binding protein [Acetobacteraceae bacterium]MBV8525069.1 heme-binding protein [Acetobacteraceae bacterium]MBV8592166.1 heme-binding protein [Acetobacteraceae bacterium]
MRTILLGAALSALVSLGSPQTASADFIYPEQCALGTGVAGQLQSVLNQVVASGNGGLFTPNLMWAAIVDRNGILCAVAKSGDAWPYSRQIAIAKAGTANGLSNNKLALSTANLYSAVQPGGSLYGLNESNPYNPFFNRETAGSGPGSGEGFTPGGVITFGGGVALYQNGNVIGGLGVSGDTSCADHAIAYQMRHLLGLDGIPAGAGLNGTDNIVYLAPGEAPNGFKHPHCLGESDVTP